MAFGAIDCPARGVDDFRNILRGLETKLSEAKARRDKILVDLRKASAAIDAGDQKARFLQGSLNKENVAAGRLILSIEMEVGKARKRLAPGRADRAAVPRQPHSANAAGWGFSGPRPAA